MTATDGRYIGKPVSETSGMPHTPLSEASGMPDTSLSDMPTEMFTRVAPRASTDADRSVDYPTEAFTCILDSQSQPSSFGMTGSDASARLVSVPDTESADLQDGQSVVSGESTEVFTRIVVPDTPYVDRTDDLPTEAFTRIVADADWLQGNNASSKSAPQASSETPDVASSAALISICVIISRITGFIRTWAMGFAMGTTLLSSSYQVACNLPNQLYELVMGGMLVTAFLPVYVSLQKREGKRRANEYASTLMGIVLILLGLIALAATIWAPQVVFTQMFLNPAGDRELVTYFFRFFAIQLLFYGISAVVGGLLNAERDYFWSSAAPIANNLVVIVVMFVYVFIAPSHPEVAKTCIAVGTPLGVFVQMAMQLPALMKHGIHLKPWRINLADPALRETLALGIPTIIVTIGSFLTVSVQNATAMAINDAGSSVLFYARQWFTLPYAFLSVPLTTTLFTELSNMVADKNISGVRTAVCAGMQQNLFFMIPFALYLVVFSVPLVTLFCAGSFTEESVHLVAGYLAYMAISLPFYAIFLFMQKVFSALRYMKAYAVVNVVMSVAQVGLTMVLGLGIGQGWQGFGLPGIAIAQTIFFLVGVIWCCMLLHRSIGLSAGRALVRTGMLSLFLGLLGSIAGATVLIALNTFAAPFAGNIGLAFIYICAGGIVSLVVTFGLALVLRIPEAAMIGRILSRFRRH